MAIASLQVAVPLAHLTVGKRSLVKRRGNIRSAENDLQARGKVELPKITDNISRRDAMSCMTVTLLATFLVTGPAEARSVKPETRRKIREKLDKLREKGEVLKERTEPRSSDEGKQPSSPPYIPVVPLVEATN